MSSNGMEVDVSEEAELSEGEVVEEKQEGQAPDNHAKNAEDGKDEPSEPEAKKPKLQPTAGGQGEDGEGWLAPTKRQLRKIRQRKRKEKKRHQEIEDKYAATLQQKTASSPAFHLNARQGEVIKALLQISRGEQHQSPNQGHVQKLKTLQFQNVVSYLVTGHPQLGEPLKGADSFREEHRVVVVWLSMISSEFAREQGHFPKLKRLSPCVTFDIEHPGSSRYVKFGLESFMMLSVDDHASSSQPFGAESRDSDVPAKPPQRYAYLFSLSELSDNDFPTPPSPASEEVDGGGVTTAEGGGEAEEKEEGQGAWSVDERGRDVGSYVSIVEWPSGEISDAPQVVAAGKEEGGENDKKMPLFAIDCEMVQTGEGSELGRISIVNEDLECVYNTLVKPGSPVLDYRTLFSGLTASLLEGVTTTLSDVQAQLSHHLPANSILVGHSLENDFHAMRFRHPFVIDTSCLFTPLATPTAKPGLRKLCKELLGAEIQTSNSGHDSIEDATACMKLVKLKLRKGRDCKVAFNEISPSIFTDYRTRGCVTGIVDKDSVVRLFGRGSSLSEEVTGDDEAVARTLEILPQSKFTFVQLHGMECLLKSAGGGGGAGGGADPEKIQEVADNLDSQVLYVCMCMHVCMYACMHVNYYCIDSEEYCTEVCIPIQTFLWDSAIFIFGRYIICYSAELLI